MRSPFPMIDGSDPRRSRHNRPLITARGVPPGRSSASSKKRPSSGRAPSVGKYEAVTRCPHRRSAFPPKATSKGTGAT